MTTPDPCDQEIFDKGKTICSFHAAMDLTEEWVKKLANISGQRVDWHYVGGYACVRYLGDYSKVREALTILEPDLVKIKAEVFRVYEES